MVGLFALLLPCPSASLLPCPWSSSTTLTIPLSCNTHLGGRGVVIAIQQWYKSKQLTLALQFFIDKSSAVLTHSKWHLLPHLL
jgi:hypothetical protein